MTTDSHCAHRSDWANVSLNLKQAFALKPGMLAIHDRDKGDRFTLQGTPKTPSIISILICDMGLEQVGLLELRTRKSIQKLDVLL